MAMREADPIAPPVPIPFEILQPIFCLYCQSSNFRGLETDPRDTLAVFTLMQVCLAWQQIVLKTPELWSAVFITHHPCPRDFELARRWLSRAGNIPRTLKFTFQSSNHVPLTATHDLISQYPFRTLRFEAYLSNRMVDFSKIRAESLLPLERLEFSRHSGYPHIELTFPPHTFPNLLSLQISGSFKILPFKTMPWPSLRQLDMFGVIPPSLSESLTILRDATALEHAKIVVLVDTEVPSTGGIVAANLSVLNVGFDTSCNAGNFLDMLTAPKLKALTLDNHYGSGIMECDISALRRFVALSGIEMEELSISRTTMPLSVGALLDCMPSLRRLELCTNSLLDEDSMKRIANGELGPRLEELTIRVQLISPEAAAPILAMIESRQSSQSETRRGHSYVKKVMIRVLGKGPAKFLRNYKEQLGELKGTVEFRLFLE